MNLATDMMIEESPYGELGWVLTNNPEAMGMFTTHTPKFMDHHPNSWTSFVIYGRSQGTGALDPQALCSKSLTAGD